MTEFTFLFWIFIKCLMNRTCTAVFWLHLQRSVIWLWFLLTSFSAACIIAKTVPLKLLEAAPSLLFTLQGFSRLCHCDVWRLFSASSCETLINLCCSWWSVPFCFLTFAPRGASCMLVVFHLHPDPGWWGRVDQRQQCDRLSGSHLSASFCCSETVFYTKFIISVDFILKYCDFMVLTRWDGFRKRSLFLLITCVSAWINLRHLRTGSRNTELFLRDPLVTPGPLLLPSNHGSHRQRV